ncbi:MAG: RagB/SusD family nutrient uptake outer membrane protein [Prevotella sp.]|nr:RagB/SusD family nutrient uptake outer membrane protein [Prevotella sp.]
MNKNKFFQILALGTLSLSVMGCSDDFLDRPPLNQYTAETFYSSDEAVIKATEPLYNKAWSYYNNNAIIGMGSLRANDSFNPYNNAEFALFQTTGLTQDVSHAWGAMYTVVTFANAILNNIPRYCYPEVSEEVKNQALGEAHLMRGVAYFYLLRAWGEVILFEDNDEAAANPIMPLSTEESVLEFIVRDLEAAAELLPAVDKDNHPSLYAAKALLAKVLLAQSGWNKGGTRDEQTLKRVVSLCDEVINSGTYALLDDYENLFRPQYNDNSETILAMRWADPLVGGWGTVNALVATLTFAEVTDVAAWGGNLSATPDMIDYYNEEPADSFRLRATFFTQNRHYDYIRSDEGGYTYKKKWMQNKKGVVGTTADCDGHLKGQASPLNTYIMRYADVFLIKAEALLGNQQQTDDPEALAAFNALRLRAKLPARTKPITFEDIIRERRIEFCMEYSNWYDFVTWYRWKPEYMLNFFNNKQHRAYIINENDIIRKDDNTFAYTGFPVGTWYSSVWDYDLNGDGAGDEVRYWSDGLRDTNGEIVTINGVPQDLEHGYKFNLDSLIRAKIPDGAVIVSLSEKNIFMPYPESDVLQNPNFRKDPINYKFDE